jgi:hypothetical protein
MSPILRNYSLAQTSWGGNLQIYAPNLAMETYLQAELCSFSGIRTQKAREVIQSWEASQSMFHAALGHAWEQTPVANTTLLTAFSSISSVSAMTSLLKTLNLSHNPHPKNLDAGTARPPVCISMRSALPHHSDQPWLLSIIEHTNPSMWWALATARQRNVHSCVA